MLARFKNQHTDVKVGSIPVLKPFQLKQKKSENMNDAMFILVPFIKMMEHNKALKQEDKSHRYRYIESTNLLCIFIPLQTKCRNCPVGLSVQISFKCNSFTV